MSYTQEAIRMLPLFMVQNGAHGHTNPWCICVWCCELRRRGAK